MWRETRFAWCYECCIYFFVITTAQRGEWSHLEKTDELMYHAEDLSEDPWPNFEDEAEEYDELQELVDLDEEDWEQLGKKKCRKQSLTDENWVRY